MGAGLFAHRSLVLPSSQQDGNTIKPPFPSAAFGPDARRFLQAGEGGCGVVWGIYHLGARDRGQAACRSGTPSRIRIWNRH